MIEALFLTLHLLGALGMVAGLFVASLAASSLASGNEKHELAYLSFRKIYAFTTLAILLSVSAGLVLWLVVGKPTGFFSNNPVFHVKIALVVLTLTTLIYPAWCLCRPHTQHRIPAVVLGLQKCSVALLLIVPVLAYLMARGVGY
jgi:putative membrane protein